MGQKSMGKPDVIRFRQAVTAACVVGVFCASAFLWWIKPAVAEEIVCRLKWLKNMSAVGELYAKRYGIFEKEGLQVTLHAGGPERDAIKELELGYAHFGVASGDQVIRALAKGSPVVVIAQIFQINPLQWIYHGDEPVIDTVQALKGKTIGVTFGGNDETILRTLLAGGGLSEKDVRLFSVRYDYTPFYTRRVALWPVYQNSQAIFIREKLTASGKSVRVLDPARFGVRFAANSVVTSRHMLASRPDTVKRFATALIAGWQEALKPENRESALHCVEPFDRDTPFPILEKQLTATAALVRPDPLVPIGAVDVSVWCRTEQIMRDQGLISAPVNIRSALFPLGAPVTTR